jgi:hypothetical protein
VQIVLFIILVLLVVVILVSKKDTMGKNTKISLFIAVAILSLIIYFYESFQENSALQNREIVNAFRQGKTLTCKEYDSVNKKDFIYVSGTQTFIPKSGIETLEGVIVRVSTCSVKK